MQLKKSLPLSSIVASVLATSALLQAENYVSVEYMQYDESDDRMSISAPMVEASYDFNTDYNLKANFMFDSVSGATPTINENSGTYTQGLQEFEDERKALSLMLTSRFENRDELYTGFEVSQEEDYESKSFSAEYMHYLDATHNTAISVGGSVNFNEILHFDATAGPSPFANYDSNSGASYTEESTTYNIQAGVTQVLDKSSSIKVSAFMLSDDGYLSNQHINIVRDYNTPNATLAGENRPDSRMAYGVVAQYNKLLTSDTAFIGSHRFYTDDWDISSYTLEADVYTNISKQFTLGAGLRYYTQTEANFYNGNMDYFTDETYASNDERLSDFDALTYKVNMNYKYNDLISYNLGVQLYQQNTDSDMSATTVTTGLKYKF